MHAKITLFSLDVPDPELCKVEFPDINRISVYMKLLNKP